MRWYFFGINKLYYKVIVTYKIIWSIFIKTEKALFKIRYSSYFGIWKAYSRVIGTFSFKLYGIITLAKGWIRIISKRCIGIWRLLFRKASAFTSISVICINTDKALRKIIRSFLNGLRKSLNVMTLLFGIIWLLCIITEKEDLSIFDRFSICIVKFSYSELEMSVKKFVRLRIYCRDKNKGRGILFGLYFFYCCAKLDYYGLNGRFWNWLWLYFGYSVSIFGV